jgi:hypothetical protein
MLIIEEAFIAVATEEDVRHTESWREVCEETDL